jgi:hypothetical protein
MGTSQIIMIVLLILNYLGYAITEKKEQGITVFGLHLLVLEFILHY